MRTDENLSRPSFRFSSEWKRPGSSAGLAPEIDARLAGVEQRGDKLVVHSLSGNERNHYFANREGRSFEDLSALSGLDTAADSRGFAVFDYNRDGWQDVALVNAGRPLFNLYRNEMPAAQLSGGLIAIKFVGGNRTPAASKEFSARDGYGARITADLGDMKLIREHRCGDGFAAQHSATMILGLGTRPVAASLTVRWPSGKVTSTNDVPEGTLVTAFENAADSPTAEPFVRSAYRVQPGARPAPVPERSAFALTAADSDAQPKARLRLYTTLATWCPACKKHLPMLRRLNDELAGEGVELIAVPIDEADDNQKLADYAKEWRLPSRIVALDAARRIEASAAFSKALGEEAPLPCSVVTNQEGHILTVQAGVPSVSALRKLLHGSGG